MAQKIEFVLDANDAGLVQAWLAAKQSVVTYEQSLGKVGQAELAAAKAAADAQKTRDAAVQRSLQIQRALETADEKHARQIAEINDLYTAGAMTAQQWQSSITRLTAAREADSDAAREQAQRQKQLQAIATASIASTKSAMDVYRAKVADLKAAHAAGLLTQEQFNRALRQEREQLIQNSGRLDERKKKEQELAAMQRTVLAAIQTPQQKYNEQLQRLNTLRQANKLSEQQYAAAVKQTRAELDALTTSTAGVDAAVGLLAKGWAAAAVAVTAYSQANREAQRESESAADKLDRLQRQSKIQSGRTDEGQAAADQRIQGTAVRNAVRFDRAYQAETALSSAGFSAEDASGEALEIFLQIMNAQGLQDADPEQYVLALQQYMNSQQMTVNAGNLKKLGTQLQSKAIKETAFKLVDMPQLAMIGQGLSGRLTQEEQVATIATLRDAIGIEKAKTSFGDIMTNLTGVHGKSDALKELEGIGLDPKSIDFVGEDFSTVMGNLRKGLDHLPAEKRTAVLGKLIEKANISTYDLLQAEMPRIQERAGQLNDPAQFDSDVATARSGRSAAKTRLQVEEELAQAQKAELDEVTKQALKKSLRAQGLPEWQVKMRAEGFSAFGIQAPGIGYEGMRGLGFSPETSAYFSGDLGGQTLPAVRQNAQQAMQAPAQNEQTELLKKQVQQNDELIKLTKESKSRPNMPNVRPPAPVASTALGAGSGRP